MSDKGSYPDNDGEQLLLLVFCPQILRLCPRRKGPLEMERERGESSFGASSYDKRGVSAIDSSQSQGMEERFILGPPVSHKHPLLSRLIYVKRAE